MNSVNIPEESQRIRLGSKAVDFGPPPNNQNIKGLEDCGHLPVLEQPVRLINNFLFITASGNQPNKNWKTSMQANQFVYHCGECKFLYLCRYPTNA